MKIGDGHALDCSTRPEILVGWPMREGPCGLARREGPGGRVRKEGSLRRRAMQASLGGLAHARSPDTGKKTQKFILTPEKLVRKCRKSVKKISRSFGEKENQQIHVFQQTSKPEIQKSSRKKFMACSMSDDYSNLFKPKK